MIYILFYFKSFVHYLLIYIVYFQVRKLMKILYNIICIYECKKIKSQINYV